jgi:hypothetical protein
MVRYASTGPDLAGDRVISRQAGACGKQQLGGCVWPAACKRKDPLNGCMFQADQRSWCLACSCLPAVLQPLHERKHPTGC